MIDYGEFRLGAYALCLDTSGRLLLSRVSAGVIDEGMWTIPGGGVDWGEHPEEAAARELLEETGLHALGFTGVAGIYSKTYTAEESARGRFHHVGIVFSADGVEGEPRAERDGTSDGAAWFARVEIEDVPLTPLGAFGVGLAWPVSEPAAP